jgi:ABC-type phosphate transport system permease subunit
MESFLSSLLIALSLLSIGMFFLRLAFSHLPSFPGELVATFVTGIVWSDQQHQGLPLLLKMVRFGIEVVIAGIGAVAFFVGALHAYLTAIHETGYCCLKLRSALKKLSESSADHISIHQLVRKYQGIRILNTLFNSVYGYRFYIILV